MQLAIFYLKSSLPLFARATVRIKMLIISDILAGTDHNISVLDAYIIEVDMTSSLSPYLNYI